MQVTCPNCGARYLVNPLAIGPGGRTVECARCHERWFEKAQGMPDFSPFVPLEQPAVAPAKSGPTDYNSQLPAITPPKQPVRWRRWITAIAALVLVSGVMIFAYLGEISSKLLPQWRTIFGFDVVRGFLGSHAKAMRLLISDRPRLEVDVPESRIDVVDGRYVVRGDIVNTGRTPGSTSRIKLIFRNDREVLAERVFAMVKGPIAPGGRMGFNRPFDDPPDGTTTVVPSVE
jgi:predicted Zn finger-like uncharacterized protein